MYIKFLFFYVASLFIDFFILNARYFYKKNEISSKKNDDKEYIR